jgi:hypothetical protein
MRNILILTFSFCLFFQSSFCLNTTKLISFEKVQDGVLLKTSTGIMKLRVINDRIIQVVVSPDKKIKNTPNLSEAEHLPVFKYFKLSEDKDDIILRTKQLTVRVSKSELRVRYYDLMGKLILAESTNGKGMKANFQPNDSA